MTDAELVAAVMRRFLAGSGADDPFGPWDSEYWRLDSRAENGSMLFTLDGSILVTEEEVAAIERLAGRRS